MVLARDPAALRFSGRAGRADRTSCPDCAGPASCRAPCGPGPLAPAVLGAANARDSFPPRRRWRRSWFRSRGREVKYLASSQRSPCRQNNNVRSSRVIRPRRVPPAFGGRLPFSWRQERNQRNAWLNGRGRALCSLGVQPRAIATAGSEPWRRGGTRLPCASRVERGAQTGHPVLTARARPPAGSPAGLVRSPLRCSARPTPGGPVQPRRRFACSRHLGPMRVKRGHLISAVGAAEHGAARQALPWVLSCRHKKVPRSANAERNPGRVKMDRHEHEPRSNQPRRSRPADLKFELPALPSDLSVRPRKPPV